MDKPSDNFEVRPLPGGGVGFIDRDAPTSPTAEDELPDCFVKLGHVDG